MRIRGGTRTRARGRTRGRGWRLCRGARRFGFPGPVLLAAGLVLGSGAAAPAGGQSTHVLVVSGLGGAPEYTTRFGEWGSGMVRAAEAAGVPADHVVWLAEDDALDPRVSGVARREAVSAALVRLAELSSAGDLVLIVLFGHGSARGEEVRLNLPGPDLSAGDLAALLEPLSDRRIVVVNAASASGGFVEPLSAPGRVVITATRSARQNEATRFGGYFVDALAGEAADTDKDGRVSMLEAFEFARLEVARGFSEEGHLPTEHALLDDDGDGRGSMEPGETDGELAAVLALAPARTTAGTGTGAETDPGLATLRAEEARLRAELAELRARRGSMDADAYQAELERLLLEIARNGRAIRDAQGEEGGGS